MSDRHFVKRQKLKEIGGNNDAYEKWHRASGEIKEDARANPDSLIEDQAMYANGGPSTPQFIMGEAVDHLQGRQKEVYMLIMREGKSFAEVAEILEITKGSVQVYADRANKFITAYCRAAIDRGRV